jgi:hypothetical protein
MRFQGWYYKEGLPATMGLEGKQIWPVLVTLAHDVIKPVDYWAAAYRDPFDPAGFRAWLRGIFSPPRRYDIGEGYGFSQLWPWAGLLTFRYLKLYAHDVGPLYQDPALSTLEGAREFDHVKNVLAAVIRTEFLEQDFVAALSSLGLQPSAEQRQQILAFERAPTNTSHHAPTAQYYDDETSALVANRERLIIEKYNYRPPTCPKAAPR